MYYTAIPTIFPAENFDPQEDAQALKNAIDGLGTDEQTIINILTTRCNCQRQEIKQAYSQLFDKDLIEDIKGDTSGDFENVLVGLMLPPVEYLCKELHEAMEGYCGTDEEALIEILCSKTNEEIQCIVQTYESMYNRPLVEHLCSETSGEFRRFLSLIVTCVRDESGEVDVARAREQAEELYAAGEDRWGTDKSTFSKILAHENYCQLLAIFEEYKNVSGNTIEQAIKKELSSDYKDCLLALVQCVQFPPIFFAKRLYHAMHGWGTNETTLTRIIVSRCEIDLENIKKEFEILYEKTLESYIKKDTSGDYRRALLALVKCSED